MECRMIKRPRIIANEEGSTVTVVHNEVTGDIVGVITVQQGDIIAYISGPLDVITSIQYEADEEIGGRIITIDSYDPPIPGDVESFMYSELGGVKVYRIYVYSFNALEKDQII